ncbi:MAG: anthranilate synthase component I family protein, partial [Planctomycetota bacterium]|nr:anthranilate synthase component I family protein [Planctomycetota bacterium]
MARCDAALVHDAQTGEWHAVGEPTQARELMERALEVEAACVVESTGGAQATPSAHDAYDAPSITLMPVESDAQYEADVRRAIEYVHAGDVFQVNVARRFVAPVPDDLANWRAIGARALTLARYGAYLEPSTDCAIASYSPELFLTVDGTTGRIVTRPIKGTSAAGSAAMEAPPTSAPSAARPSARAAFESSAKERAELHMIVDLMRNDLARVCQPRTVRVTNARVLEDHPTVLHGVGEVEGTLRSDASLLDILRATFPPGSVTGAPKIRAVQVIRELERSPRGPYCGAIGCLSDCGSMTWSVAIRTATMTGAHLTYWAGCGVVAESESRAEVAESHAKAAVVGARVSPS